jgi:hypothetical protein
MSKPHSVAGTGSDPTVEYAELEIDGKVYQLAYDFNAIAEAEAVARAAGTPINLLQGMAAVLLNDVTAEQLRGLLWAAARKAHYSLTVERRSPKDMPKPTLLKVGALIRVDTLPDIREALLRAWNASLPEDKKFLRDPPEGAGAPPPAPES